MLNVTPRRNLRFSRHWASTWHRPGRLHIQAPRHQLVMTTRAPTGSAGLLAEYLKSPDDLSKISSLRRKLTREHAALSAKLKIGAKDQLEATREGLLQLQATRREVAGIHEVFEQVESMFREPQESEDGNAGGETKGTRSFRTINEMSHIHRTLVQTSDMLAKFESMTGEVRALAEVLERHQRDLLGPAPDLLLLHYRISGWESFRNETLRTVAADTTGAREELEALFMPLDTLITAFEKYLFALGTRVLDLVRAGRPSVVVRLVKIMERENREDEKAAAIRLAKKANLEGAARFQSIVTTGRVIKLYRLRFQETIQNAVRNRLEAVWNQYVGNAAGGAGPLDFLDNVNWLFTELEMVRTMLVPLFPADFNVYKTYVQAYHRGLRGVLMDHVLHEEVDASTLLALYRYAQEYRGRLLNESTGIEESWLEPSLLDGREQTIIGDYQGLILRKIVEWTATLMHDEITAFVLRDKPPEENANGMYLLSSAVILFRIINQQVDTALHAGDAEVLVRVVDHACLVLRNCQTSWLQTVQQEFKRQTDARRADEVPGGLVEYLIALANDQLASADHAQELLHRLESLVADKYKAHVRETVDNTLNGFLDVSKHCTQLLVELVLYDLRPAFRDLFTFPAWYVEGTTATIVETVRDYASDYAARLDPNLFDVLSDDLFTRVLTAYLTSLRRAARLRMPKAADRVRTDASELSGLFLTMRPAEEVQQRMEVLNMIHAILSSSPTMVFLPYWTFAKAHGPNLAFFEALLRARDDMEKADVASLVDSARRKVKQEAMPEVPETGATIMSAVSQAQGGGLFGTLPWSSLAQSAQSYLGAGWRREGAGGADTGGA